MPAIIPIPAFSDNYIWLLREGGRAAVVEPGDAAPVLAILATHNHRDHLGGIEVLVFAVLRD